MSPVYTKDDFLFFKEVNKPEMILGDRLIIEPAKLADTIKYINKNSIKSITINPAYFVVEHLDFLKDIPAIEGLYLLQQFSDLSDIHCLKSLRALTFNKINKPLDFDNFPQLEVLGTDYNKHLINLAGCKKLFWLWLDKFNHDDIGALKGLSNLSYLNLYSTTIKSLEGIQHLKSLTHLRIITASRLETLNGISLENILRVIDIDNAKKLSDYNSIRNAKELDTLFLSRSGNADDLSFIDGLSKLNKIILGINILNGDLNPLLSIKDVSFTDHSHYSLKFKEFKKKDDY